MNAKEYLSQVQTLRHLLTCREGELSYWQGVANNITASNFEPHYNATRSTSAAFERAIEKVDEIQRAVDSAIIELVNKCDEINRAIDALSDIQEQTILRYHYLEDLPLYQAGRRMKISESTVYRIHANALKNLKVPE